MFEYCIGAFATLLLAAKHKSALLHVAVVLALFRRWNRGISIMLRTIIAALTASVAIAVPAAAKEADRLKSWEAWVNA